MVAAATTTLGEVVVDGAGMTLCMFTRDTQGTTTSACTGQCLAAWPLVVADTTPKLTGVTGPVGSIPTADGRKQVTLGAWPLYHYYAKDAKAGDVTGQNVNQVWFVLTAAGVPVK
jgi:predicted lipoprotein with Yx(FWY)xxD motif